MNFSEWISGSSWISGGEHSFRSAIHEGCDVDKLLSLMCLVCKCRVDDPNYSVYDAAARMILLDMAGGISSDDAGIMVATFIPLMFGLDIGSEENRRSYQSETFAAATKEVSKMMKEKHPDKALDIDRQCAAAIEAVRSLKDMNIPREDFSREVMKNLMNVVSTMRG